MFIEVNGARLFVDIEGAGLVPDGPAMRTKPTLILLHGGPGADHTIFKPAFSALSDVCQIVYYDHRGNGRSGGDDPAGWNLAQWGDDVKGLCDALGIEKPIIYGASFGGFVAQAYAIRHPEHPAKLILANTAARVDFSAIFAAFARVAGDAARQVAETYWRSPTPALRKQYMETCVPFYQRRRGADSDWRMRAIIKDDVAMHFNGPDNEQGRLDFRSVLADVRCPVLVLAGEYDPIMPPEFAETVLCALPTGGARLIIFKNASHAILSDRPADAMQAIREFITEDSAEPNSSRPIARSIR